MKPAAILTTLAIASQAAAQNIAPSFEVAVQTNFALATDLCMQTMLSGAPPSGIFTAAGFIYRAADRGVNQFGVDLGSGHYFDAPAETAKAEVINPNTHPGLCTATTRHLDQAAAAQLIGAMILQRFPTTDASQPNQWIVRGQGPLPLIISIGTIGTNHRYEQPGTVQVSMTFPG